MFRHTNVYFNGMMRMQLRLDFGFIFHCLEALAYLFLCDFLPSYDTNRSNKAALAPSHSNYNTVNHSYSYYPELLQT